MHHLIKQQQAWFYMSKKPNTTVHTSKLKNIVDNFAIYSVTWGLFLMYMAQRDRYWFTTGDVVDLPINFYEPILSVVFLAIFIYVLYYFYFYIKIALKISGQHFYLLAACISWGFGLKSIHTYFPNYKLFTILCHVVPYFYLCGKYINVRLAIGEKFVFKIKNVSLVLVLILAISVALAYYEFYVYRMNFLWLYFIFVTINIVHYSFDRFFWKRSSHPEGAAILTN
jgi:hypothetical protein